MKFKSSLIKVVSLVLSFMMIFAVASPSSFAATNIFSKDAKEAARVAVTDEIVEVARAEIGFYESNINKFTTWYYGYETDAYWCSIFVSWCAGQVGAIGTAVPKRSACSSMRNWFEMRGEYYPVDTDYIPQKGDIVFINTEVDDTDDVHHVEIITENGFFGDESNPKIKCIGGNTSDLNYIGSEYVTEKTRPINSSRAQIVGYAHPSYEKCNDLTRDFNIFNDKNTPDFSRNIQSKFISMIYNMEVLWNNFVTLVNNSIQKSNENFKNACASVKESFNSLKIRNNADEESVIETTVSEESIENIETTIQDTLSE